MCAAISDSFRPLTGLVSIHDVMPETRQQVTAMLTTLALPPQAVTLLVVPGRQWQRDDLAWLQGLQRQGHPLAGHGWSHRCSKPVSLYHKLHSLLLSRDVAEHLSLSGNAIVQLIHDCHGWFAEHDLAVSPLYVPPAWALGALNHQQLSSLPFRYVETLSGVLDTKNGARHPLPLVGFEADTPWRAWVLTLFNNVNRARSKAKLLPLRVGLHPDDLQLRMAATILPMIRNLGETLDYPQAISMAPLRMGY